MAMTWLQQMFTPERSGSYQWQGRPDQGGGEFTGEQRDAQGNITYEGDAQDLRFVPRAKRGPGNTVGQKMQNATPNATEGMGQNATQDMMDAVRATGLGGNYDSGGMSSISEVMQSSFGGPTADELDVYDVSSPPGTMNPSTMTAGSRRWSGMSDTGANALPESWMQAPNAFSTGDADPLKKIRALREHPSDATFYEGLQGIGERQGQDMMHALALQDDAMNAGSNDAALQPGPTTPSVSDGFGESRAQDYMGGQQTEPTAIAQLMKLLGRMGGGMLGDMFSPSQAGAGIPGPTTPKIAPPMFVPPDTLGSTGGQFKDIYEGQTGGSDVMNALQAYMRRSN